MQEIIMFHRVDELRNTPNKINFVKL